MTSNLFRGQTHALLYSKFRPSPPQEFIRSILNYLQNKVNSTLKHAVDIGCGSGQSTIVLSPYFKKVTGCDISESQIDYAQKERSSDNIEYKVANCEQLPFPDSSVELVTSSQAVHWFDTSKLFSEVKRILVPNGVVAVYGYWIPFPKTGYEEKDEKLSSYILELHDNQLGKYWNDERNIVKNHYQDVNFPFKDVQRLNLTKTNKCSLAEYIGYLRTWSAYQKLYNEDKVKGEKMLKEFESKCSQLLGQTQSSKEITFSLHTDFFMLMGHH